MWSQCRMEKHLRHIIMTEISIQSGLQRDIRTDSGVSGFTCVMRTGMSLVRAWISTITITTTRSGRITRIALTSFWCSSESLPLWS